MKPGLLAIIFAAVVGCLCCCQHVPLHVDVDRNVYPVKGVDLSAHNGDVDFARVAADSVSFVLLKATEGTDFCDARFAGNLAGARANGLKVGAYHFFRFDAQGHQQAYHFMRTVGNAALDLPLAIDVEDWHNAEGVPPSEVVAQLCVMIDVLRSAGHRVMIYTNRNGYADYASQVLAAYPDVEVWMGSPSSLPANADWTLWQHSHEGEVDGVDGAVDINTYKGTRADFDLWSAHGDSINTILNSTSYD